MEECSEKDCLSSTSSTIAQFLTDTGKKAETSKCYSRHLSRLARWLRPRGRTLLEATRQDLSDYLADLNSSGRSATYNVVCSAFRGFFAWAKSIGAVDADPTAKLQSKRRPPSLRYDWGTIEKEVNDVIRSIPLDSPLGRRDRLLIELMLELGLSCNGVAMLRIDQFSRDGFVCFRQNLTSMVEYKLPDDLVKRLLDYIDNDHKEFLIYDEDRWVLFPSKWGGTLVRQSMWKLIAKRARAAGVEISPKKIRCATMAKMAFRGQSMTDMATRISMSPDRIRLIISEMSRLKTYRSVHGQDGLS